MTKRIDVHAHFVPDGYRAALAAAGVTHPDGIKALPQWTEEAALASMAELEIAKSYLSISSPGIYFGDTTVTTALAREVNEEAVRIQERHPERFGFFASVGLPDEGAALDETVYALDYLGADGITLMTNTAGIYLGDERLDPIYHALNERGSILFVHPTTPHGGEHLALGYPRPMLEFMFETTRSITNMILSGVLARYPDMRVIVPHAGAALPVLAKRIELLLPILTADSDIEMPSITSALGSLYFDIAGAAVPELLTALVAVADEDKLLYGSDFPFTPARSGLSLADIFDQNDVVDEAVKQAINKSNAERLFAD